VKRLDPPQDGSHPSSGRDPDNPTPPGGEGPIDAAGRHPNHNLRFGSMVARPIAVVPSIFVPSRLQAK
jgi:hypothetical protein